MDSQVAVAAAAAAAAGCAAGWLCGSSRADARTVSADAAAGAPPAEASAATYVPPPVWAWDKSAGGKFASINRPVSGALSAPLPDCHLTSTRWCSCGRYLR